MRQTILIAGVCVLIGWTVVLTLAEINRQSMQREIAHLARGPSPQLLKVEKDAEPYEAVTPANLCARFRGFHKHQQLKAFIRRNQILAVCGSCGDEIQLVNDFGTNNTPATLENIHKL